MSWVKDDWITSGKFTNCRGCQRSWVDIKAEAKPNNATQRKKPPPSGEAAAAKTGPWKLHGVLLDATKHPTLLHKCEVLGEFENLLGACREAQEQYIEISPTEVVARAEAHCASKLPMVNAPDGKGNTTAGLYKQLNAAEHTLKMGREKDAKLEKSEKDFEAKAAEVKAERQKLQAAQKAKEEERLELLAKIAAQPEVVKARATAAGDGVAEEAVGFDEFHDCEEIAEELFPSPEEAKRYQACSLEIQAAADLATKEMQATEAAHKKAMAAKVQATKEALAAKRAALLEMAPKVLPKNSGGTPVAAASAAAASSGAGAPAVEEMELDEVAKQARALETAPAPEGEGESAAKRTRTSAAKGTEPTDSVQEAATAELVVANKAKEDNKTFEDTFGGILEQSLAKPAAASRKQAAKQKQRG